jgi:phosphatidylinositol alpha-1,6-mannosyltransferase
MNSTLLVTNDFPPKVGGIQSYLWELWRRLDPNSTAVLTARSHPDHAAFDREQSASGLRITRVPSRVLYLPSPLAARRVRREVVRRRPGLVLLDPAWPLGLLGPRLPVPYGVVLHGAELTIPARIPIVRRRLAKILRGSTVVVSAGGYPLSEAERLLGAPLANPVVVPPGVDWARYAPIRGQARAAGRREMGLPEDALVVVSVSRLVPRKGMDVLIEAAARLAPAHPDLVVTIAGEGRDRGRLERLAARRAAPVRFLGRVSDAQKALLLGIGDVFVMACRNRWGGLEQEGFGIVFVEAAAAGLPQVAGNSGGAAEAVADGETGFVVQRPEDPAAVAAALRPLLQDEALRLRMGAAARERVATGFDQAMLASRLAEALAEVRG